MVCSLTMLHGAVCSAQSRAEGDRSHVRTASIADKYDGPLRRAASNQSRFSAPRLARNLGNVRDDASGKRPWIERHPVITGALVGFGIGVGLTYATAPDKDEVFLTPISAGSAALVWGGVTAGLGALAGWGISRADK